MRAIIAILALTVVIAATGAADAAHSRISKANKSTHTAKIHQLERRFYHSGGYLRAIGRVAHRTIYSSNPAVRQRWRHAAHWLASVHEDARQKLYALRHPAAPQSAWPPHHALWECIGGYEGSPTSVNPNGHYGMLQMHWNWGYGIVGAASNYSQVQQEWAAERAYQANSYSSAFLYGQWFDYDGAAGACMQYAR